MIGVVPGHWERRAVEEFFELFKVPWEFCRPGASYAVLIGHDFRHAAQATRLCVVSNPAHLDDDPAPESAVRGDGLPRVLCDDGICLPIYRGLTAFKTETDGEFAVAGSGAQAAWWNDRQNRRIVRLGYDLFEEARFLLSEGQPPECAAVPALDVHIARLRRLILGAGIPLVELPCHPVGYNFIACLTHDVDFLAIRDYPPGPTLAGFLCRATAGSLVRFLRRRLPLRGMLTNWKAALTLPLIYLRLAPDFWTAFAKYREIEAGLESTYFFVPFRGVAGEHPTMPHWERRAVRYDVAKQKDAIAALRKDGCEVALHGLDAWHDAHRAVCERDRIEAVSGECDGVRMHWLCFAPDTFSLLDQAGFKYDSTRGYNDVIGYRAGTAQVFQPLQAGHLLEVPLHIQDVALFRRGGMDLPDEEAANRCASILDHACNNGGVVTALWHLHSVAPERQWGSFYAALLENMKSRGACFMKACRVADWFRMRRSVTFGKTDFAGDHVTVELNAPDPIPEPLLLRVQLPAGTRSRALCAAIQSVDSVWYRRDRAVIDLHRQTALR